MTTPENKEEEKAEQQGENKTKDIAKEIPTVTPDQDNLEPVPDPEEKK